MLTVAIYLGGTPTDGGTYQNALSLVSALSRFGEEHHVIGYCSHDEWQGILSDHGIEARQVREQGVVSRLVTKVLRELPIPIAARRTIGSRVVPFGRQLADDDVDVCLYPNFEHYAWELATPSIAQIHDLMHRYEPHFPEVAADGIPRKRDRMFSRMRTGATAVLVDSEVGREHVIESYGSEGASLHVLPYVAPDYIWEAASDGEAPGMRDWAREIRLPEKYLFYPAQFWAHKNHPRLLEAFSRVAARHDDAHLVLVGSPKNASEEVADAIGRLGLSDRVTESGYVTNGQMAYLYRHARALVFPTYFGPTNIPPLEAFVLGCPVAVSGIYGMPEQLGDAALYFDQTSVDEIAGACLRLWEDDALCERLAAAGRVRAEQWGPPQFAERLRAIITEVAR
jgi:glycosyltransferase involved in cell wall biosynthesis